MPKIVINGSEHDFEDGLALIQACEQAGVEVPRFCYHERLSVAGNCRMCLVEVVGAPKLVASCAMVVNDLRPGPEGQPPQIRTNSQLVKDGREGVMEFLLINHPLDCPICDQGGECDLQDQAMAFGVDASRYAENKRAVEDKYIGPLIKTMMTRCIHCTRCVRYMTEVAGVEDLGATGRGEDLEITTYLERGLSSELQGNAIDLCPVGALTSKPYAFQARPWELNKTESIDVMDAIGSNIRVDARGKEVLRILPRNNDAVNEEWISDKTRYVWDGLKTQRLDQPYVRRDGRLEAATWDEAFDAIADVVGQAAPERIGALAGDLAGAEEMFALKDLLNRLGSRNHDCRVDGTKLDPSLGRASYLFNATLEGLEEADAILLIGTDPRFEAPVLNTRIRKRYRAGAARIGFIGTTVDLTYPYEHLGDRPQAIPTVASGGGDFAGAMRQAERPVVIVGQGALVRADGTGILGLCGQLAQELGIVRADWNGFSVLHTAAARVAGLDLGFVPGNGAWSAVDIAANSDVLFLLGADDVVAQPRDGAVVVYLGSHGDRGAARADVILPGASYTEKSATYVNTEGRAQLTQRAVFPPGDAREDWTILRALSERLGQTLPYDNLSALRAAMYECAPALASIDVVEPADVLGVQAAAGLSGDVETSSVEPVGGDFFLTNPIARASAVMAELSSLRKGHKMAAE